MSKYTVGSVAKALVGAILTAAPTAAGLAGGADLSGLDLGEWALVLGAALTGFGGVFAVPNKDTESPAEKVTKSVQAAIQNQQVATAELEMVKQAVTGAVGVVPGIGPLAAQVINAVPMQFPQIPNGVWKP